MMFVSKHKFSRGVLHEEKGATMVEFALTSMIFFSLIIVTLESAVAGFRALTTQYIASEALRQGILFAEETDTVEELKAFIVTRGQALGIAIDPERIEICDAETLTPEGACGGAESMGVEERFLSVSVTTSTPYFLGTMVIDLVGQAIGRNERR